MTRNIIPMIDRQSGKRPAQSQRKFGRMHVEGLRCNRGKIVDLSKNGAKFITRAPWRDGQKQQVVITGARVRVCVPAVCKHVHKIGWRRYLVGVEFQGIDTNLAGAIKELVRTHCRFLDEPDLAA
ncbi:MAG: PilZ domain-containing protein [Phycisphaerales bacterium JB043]